MKILIIDNYDSFTFNLFHYVEELTKDVTVRRNDHISIADIDAYDGIILSPGPGLPNKAGICIELIRKYYLTKKILGVCLGHQAIALAFGGRLRNLQAVLHGVSLNTYVKQTNDVLYHNMPTTFACGRYHSWVVDREGLPNELTVTAVDKDNEIMSVKHKKHNVWGVQ